ncbi:MAG: helix-turn-helix domain-containing protein [Egibacteraceae bacterium]
MTATPDDVTPAGRRLADRLRDLRHAAGLTGQQLGERIRKAQPSVSRYELGQSVPSALTVDAWARACGADAAELAELAELAEAALTETSAWDHQLRAGLARQQARFGRLEAEVSTIRNFQTYFVPGLLQTAEYARCVFKFGSAHGHHDVADAVKARMDRQIILHDESKWLHFLITEEALRRRLAPPRVLVGQLDRITALLDLPNLSIGLIPLDAEVTVPASHAFVIYGEVDCGDADHEEDAWVHVNTDTDQVIIRDPDKVGFYLDLFRGLGETAVYRAHARALLTEISARFR